jgi:hypothetical protein
MMTQIEPDFKQNVDLFGEFSAVTSNSKAKTSRWPADREALDCLARRTPAWISWLPIGMRAKRWFSASAEKGMEQMARCASRRGGICGPNSPDRLASFRLIVVFRSNTYDA